jgi:phenylacetate-CoA ligase
VASAKIDVMPPASRDDWKLVPPAQLRVRQLERLNRLLSTVCQRPFYRDWLRGISLPLDHWDQLAAIPLLSKEALASDVRGLAAPIFDLPRDRYTRLHQTSGTRGIPLPVLDTSDDWRWWLECWGYVLDEAEVGRDDVALMAFSFGPFIGFWTANDSLVRHGAMVVPGGGMSSEARLQLIADHRCTIVCCTPTYALHLAAVAAERGTDLAANSVTRIIVAGEPGGSVAAVRQRIEQAWGARVIDHAGASEIGAWGFGSRDGRGLHVIEPEFIAELLVFDDRHPQGREAEDGQLAELVLTSLGRQGGPVIRYRTGDIVRGYRRHDQPCTFLWLEGGVLGRADDMLVIRGVNVFPSSIEAIVREVDAVAEFRMIATRHLEMDQLALEIESTEQVAAALGERLRDRLAMRVDVRVVAEGSLPRFEAKARRWIDRR